ncbi:MAG: hypothetical protein AAFS10_24150, partial [Myxococcota bacterium]
MQRLGWNTTILAPMFVLLVIATTTCANSDSDDHVSDIVQSSSETHWMSLCQDGDRCAEGGTCLCGVCTLPCSSGDDCTDAGPLASCVAATNSTIDALCQFGDLQSAGLCLAECQTDNDCTPIDDDLVCDRGHCTQPLASCTDTDGDGASTCDGDCDDSTSTIHP